MMVYALGKIKFDQSVLIQMAHKVCQMEAIGIQKYSEDEIRSRSTMVHFLANNLLTVTRLVNKKHLTYRVFMLHHMSLEKGMLNILEVLFHQMGYFDPVWVMRVGTTKEIMISEDDQLFIDILVEPYENDEHLDHMVFQINPRR